MNTTNLRKLALAAALGLGAPVMITACAATPTKESTGEYFDDTTLTTKVKAAFVADKTVSAMQINVETYKGVVQLSGFAKSQAEIDQAVAVARGVKGVQSVKNSVQLRAAQ